MQRTQPDFKGLKALFANCSLKRTPRKSHTEGLMRVSMDIMNREGVLTEMIRMADYQIAPGVYPDMRDQDNIDIDEWPELSERFFSANILVIGTPIWLGERSSVCSRLIERLYSHSAQLNEKGQYCYYDKVGGCIITGNEDGVKHCSSSILYALQHLGFSIPPQADSGWIGPVGPGPSYLDPDSGGPENEFTNRNTTFMTYNLLHQARVLQITGGYPPYGNSAAAWDKGTRWKFESAKRN